MVQKIINIGIMAHIDAGKTSLTESLLYTTGIKETKGSVDGMSTATDSLALEQERGITIKASTIATDWLGCKINIIDTPGHMDFIGEVERSLTVLDGAILVVSANEGVQEQTRVIYRKLQEKNIPTLVFVNKIDIPHSDIQRTLTEINALLKTPAICLTDQHGESLGINEEVIDQLLNCDDDLANAFLTDRQLTREDYQKRLVALTKQADVLPLFLGSAMQELGIQALLNGMVELLPSSLNQEESELSAFIYKIERQGTKRRLYLRLFAGTLSYRQEITNLESAVSCQINHLYRLERGDTLPAKRITSGDIAIIETNAPFKIGDWLGQPQKQLSDTTLEPPLKTAIILEEKQERGPILEALGQLMEEDPLIHVMINPDNQEISLMLFGEVQKEVILSLLLERFNLKLTLGKTRIIYKETVMTSAEAQIAMAVKPNPYWATINLKVEPLPLGSGIEIISLVSLGYLNRSFQHALFEGLRNGLQKGNAGWEVTDVKLTVTDAEYASPVSTPADFRKLAPYVIWQAIHHSGTTLLMPMVSFELYSPQTHTSKVLSELQRLGSTIDSLTLENDENCLRGKLTQEAANDLQGAFTEWTNGKGLAVLTPADYQPTEARQVNPDHQINVLRELFNKQ